MKKGVIGLSTLQWLFVRIPELVVSFIALYLIISAFTIADVDITGGEMEVLSKRLLYNIYEKDRYTGDVVVGVVDPMSMMDEGKLLKTIFYPENKFMAAKMTLRMGKEPLTGYYSKHWYERWKPVAEAKKRGEVVVSGSFSIPVTISDTNKFAIAQKMEFLQSLGEAPNPAVVESTQKEIQEIMQQGPGNSANGLLTFEILKPEKK